MRDLQLWLEAAPGGCAVPSECYAAVRSDNAKVTGVPTHCRSDEASCLGDVKEGHGPAVVDIFQRVGSIAVGVLEPGALADAAMTWPGLRDGELLRLRVAVVAVELTGSPCAVAEQAAIPAPAPPPVPAPAPDVPAPQAQHPPATPAAPVVATVAATAPATSMRSPRDEEPQKQYRPIVLNNCDQIIPNLYLGGVAAASDTQQLVQQGIRAVVCCVRELEFPTSEFSKEVEYYRVDVEDISREPIELFFPEATEFIHSWISREQPVLVHCRAGVSRSASVVISYLIEYHGYSLHDAFFLVRSHRSIVTPNIGFMEKLGEYEEAKRGTEPTIDINKYIAWYTTPERAAVPDLKPD